MGNSFFFSYLPVVEEYHGARVSKFSVQAVFKGYSLIRR